MSDEWPKKMMAFRSSLLGGKYRADECWSAWEGPGVDENIPVLVYPADQAPELDRLRTENESATKYLRTFSEELVIAGFAGGDRDVTLANLRTIIRENATQSSIIDELEDRLGVVYGEGDNLSRCENERDTLRELVREAQEYAVLPASLDRKWQERAEKALATGPSRPPGA
jgi:ribosomal protein L25 (general stress protein Ctc)